MSLRTCLIAAMLSATCGIAFADQATAPTHHEWDFWPIGGGLYLLRDAKFTPDVDGNIMVMVFSQQPIAPGAGYSLNLAELQGVPQNDFSYDVVELGPLRAQSVTIDCRRRAYEVVDERRLFPAPLWRPAKTLPVLAPLFSYVCSLS